MTEGGMTERAVAVVTGGTRGIGRAISVALARTGRSVYALYARDREAAADLAAQAAREDLAIECLRVNITDETAVDECIAAITRDAPRVEALIHSAASGVHKDVTALTPKHLKWTLDVNVFAIHPFVRGLLPYIPPGGRIIGITSQGSSRALPHYAAVGASKGALESLFRYYAQELAPKGIAVNLVCPGMVRTGALDAFPDSERRIQSATSQTPTGRLTTPDEVASVVTFMCSEAASQIVGQTIVIDGGRALT
jgi:enoyl-[acyl-carrier protein] reductase III